MSLQDSPKPGEARDTGKPCDVRLRPALPGDFGFCRALYFSCMRPLLEALGAWDEKKADKAFEEYFNPGEIRIVFVDGVEAGWIQVSQTDDEVHLDQIHLIEAVRGKRIGTQLMRETMAHARSVGKPVLLSLLRGNRAVSLYRRLGFKPDGSDKTKLHMRWDGGLNTGRPVPHKRG
jgi:ribosomal protein S18 acetylase RimI-like enzyme